MHNLFFDFSMKRWLIILFDHNKKYCYDFYISQNNVIDIGLDFIFNFLNKNHTNIKKIKNIYINIGPGNYTGLKCNINLAKTICAIYPNIKLYYANSFDLMPNLTPLKIISTTNNNYYVYNKLIDKIDFLPYITIEKLAIDNNISIISYDDIEIEKYVNHIIDNLSNFNYCNNTIMLEPLYVKSFI